MGEGTAKDWDTMQDGQKRMAELWPQLTHRDVAEQAVRMDRSVNPAVHDSMVNELTKHVAFTNKSDLWKRATVDLADITKVRQGGFKPDATTRGVTLNGEHVVIAHRLVGDSSFGHSNVRKHSFNTGWSSTAPLGEDDLGGHRSTLAHEVGHLIHNHAYNNATVPGSSGDHMSGYGKTNHHEGAAEAYAAAFARKYGHRYSNDRLANVGDKMAEKAGAVRK